MKVGMLTGGGDCPGLNAVIRAVVRKGIFHYQDNFVGFLEGWRGLVEDKSMPLDLAAVAGILPRGGTILRTSRTNPSKRPDGIERCIATLQNHKTDALIAIGGDDTLSVAEKLHQRGVKVVGVPKALILRSTWFVKPSTGFTPPPRHTTACWLLKSWVAMQAGSQCTVVSRAAPT